jgi:hypothetical protein
MANDMGEQPTPEIEPGEPNPGGVDALGGDDEAPVSPDLSPEDNPAVEDAAPAEIMQPEESNEGASIDGASEPEKESPA